MKYFIIGLLGLFASCDIDNPHTSYYIYSPNGFKSDIYWTNNILSCKEGTITFVNVGRYGDKNDTITLHGTFKVCTN